MKDNFKKISLYVPNKRGHWRFQWYLTNSRGTTYTNAVEFTSKPDVNKYLEIVKILQRNMIDTFKKIK